MPLFLLSAAFSNYIVSYSISISRSSAWLNICVVVFRSLGAMYLATASSIIYANLKSKICKNGLYILNSYINVSRYTSDSYVPPLALK